MNKHLHLPKQGKQRQSFQIIDRIGKKGKNKQGVREKQNENSQVARE